MACPVASYQLARILPVSTPLPLSSPRMNSPRRSSVVKAPVVVFTPFVVPSAGTHPIGQEVPTNAITAPIGTIPPFNSAFARRVLRSLILLTRAFHPFAVRPLPDHTVLIVRGLFYVAYPMVSAASVPKNARAESIDFLRKEGVFFVSIEEKVRNKSLSLSFFLQIKFRSEKYEKKRLL